MDYTKLKNAELLDLLESNVRNMNRYKKGSLSYRLCEAGANRIRAELKTRMEQTNIYPKVHREDNNE